MTASADGRAGMSATSLTWRTTSADETVAAGRRLGEVIEPGDLIALDGDLGAGKTCFVKGLAEGMGIATDAVRSPTFVFHHRYQAADATLHHIDAYRLGPGADLTFLDLDDLVSDAAVAIEWAEFADLTPWSPVHVRIAIGDGDERTITVESQRLHHAGLGS